ncbi:hypothetical protein Tco_1245619 [Tanacetum coccineum]
MFHDHHVFSGDANHEVPVNETFHEQTNDELTEKELKQVEANDQAIQTILLRATRTDDELTEKELKQVKALVFLKTSMLLLTAVKLLRKSGYMCNK